MKTRKYRSTAALMTIGLLVMLTPAALYADYSIDWWTIDAGGEQDMTGGAYSLSGTIGQPDAGGPMTGGDLALVGGFWVEFGEDNFCFGDLDGNGVIGLGDLAHMLANYGQGGMNYEDGDLDGDGDIDLSDLASLLAIYGTVCP